MYAQITYDSITISRFLIRYDLYMARWKDTLKAGTYSNYLGVQKKIWTRPRKASKVVPPILSLTTSVKANGTEDLAECFIPRHSINYYRAGKIVRYLLVCFECEGLHFSNDPVKQFVKKIGVRKKQMEEIRDLFAGMIDPIKPFRY